MGKEYNSNIGNESNEILSENIAPEKIINNKADLDKRLNSISLPKNKVILKKIYHIYQAYEKLRWEIIEKMGNNYHF